MGTTPVGTNGLTTLLGTTLVDLVDDYRASMIAADSALGTLKASVIDGDSSTLNAAKSDATTKANTALQSAKVHANENDQIHENNAVGRAVADANLRYGELPDRVSAIEVLGGLAPGDVSDATMASIAAQSASDFNRAMETKLAGDIPDASTTVGAALNTTIEQGGYNIGGPFTSLLNTTTGEGFIVKPTGDGRQGIFGWQFADNFGYVIHGESRVGGAAPGGFIGIGLDVKAPDGVGLGPSGILISNKVGSQGLIISNGVSNDHGSGFGFYGTQSSSAAILTRLVSRVNNPAPLLSLAVESGTPDADSVLQEWRIGGNHLSGDVNSSTGVFRWLDEMNLRNTRVNTTLTINNGTGAATPAQLTITDVANNPVIIEGSVDPANKSNGGFRFYRATGGGTFWASRVQADASGLKFQSSPVATKGSETWNTSIEIRNNALGFYGTTPITKRGATSDATDLASAITLVNALKADLIAYGLKTA